MTLREVGMRNAVNALVLALMVVLAGGVLVAGCARVQEAASRVQCRNNLRQIGLAVWNYKDTNGTHFPRATEPNPELPPERRLSWLVTLGPYFESTNLYVMLDRHKGWDAEENRYLALSVLRYLQCPADRDRPPESTLVPTNYVGIAGLGPDAAALPAEDPRAGFFGYERTLSSADIEGHTSTLLMAVETARTTGAWTAGGPPTARGLEGDGARYLARHGPFGGTHRGGANALFADASIRFLPESTDPRVIEALATIMGSAGADRIGEE